MNPSAAVMKIGWNSLYYSFWDVVLTKFSGRTDSLTDRHTRKQYDSGTEGFPWRRHKTYAKARRCFGWYNLYYDTLVDNMGIKFTHNAGADPPCLDILRCTWYVNAWTEITREILNGAYTARDFLSFINVVEEVVPKNYLKEGLGCMAVMKFVFGNRVFNNCNYLSQNNVCSM